MIGKKKIIRILALTLILVMLSLSYAFTDSSAIPMSQTIKAKAIDAT